MTEPVTELPELKTPVVTLIITKTLGYLQEIQKFDELLRIISYARRFVNNTI